jgi:hypothetical protein
MCSATSDDESRGMSNYDTSYIKAEQAYRSAQLREQIIGRREASRLRRQRRRQRMGFTTWDS